MNRNFALLIGGASVGTSLAVALASRSRVVRKSVVGISSVLPGRREKNAHKLPKRAASKTRWMLGGGGGMMAAWGAAHRGPLGVLAGLAGAAMLSRATVRRSQEEKSSGTRE